MKILDKFPISLECQKYEVILESTTPRLATFIDVVILDTINRLNGKLPKKYGETFSEILHSYIDVPRSMFYLFEERLVELAGQGLIDCTISISLNNSIHSFKLTKEGIEVLQKKRIPGKWKKVSSNVFYDQFSNVFFDKPSSKHDVVVTLPTEMISDKELMEYIEKNKIKLFTGVNSHTVFKEEFNKHIYSTYRDADIKLIIDNGELKFFNKNASILERYLNEEFPIDYIFPIEVYKEINLNKGNIRVFNDRNNIKSGVSSLPFDINNCHSSKKIKLDLRDYDLIGVDDQDREFLYNYSCHKLNGSIIPLEQFIYDKTAYHEIMDSYLNQQITELQSSNKAKKETILDTIYLVAGKQTIHTLIPKIIEVIQETSKTFIDIEFHFSTMKERSKSFNIKGINNLLNAKIKELIDDSEVIRNMPFNILFDICTKYQLKKVQLVGLIVKYVDEKDGDLISMLSEYVKEEIIVKEMKLIKKYNNSFLDGELAILNHDLKVYRDYLSLFNSYNNLKHYLGVTDVSNYSYASNINVKDLKSHIHKFQKDFDKVNNSIGNNVRKQMRELDDICDDTIDYLHIQDVKVTVPSNINFDFDTVARFIETKNYKISAYILRTIIEDNTDRELQGAEKFKSRFGKQHKKPYGYWRYINQVLHGETSGDDKKLNEALGFFKEVF